MKTTTAKKWNGFDTDAVQEYEPRHRALARRAAAGGMVLLKNENGLLPLAKGARLALYGAGAGHTVKGGTGSGDVSERGSVTLRRGLEDAGFVLTNAAWLDDYDRRFDEARRTWRDGILAQCAGAGDVMGFFNAYSSTPFFYPAGGPVTAGGTDTAVYAVARIAGEGRDRRAEKGDYFLSDGEERELDEVCRLYRHVLVVLNAGGLADLGFLDRHPQIEALLYIVQPGMEGGNAFADVLLGKVCPSGRLTDTWPLHYSDLPNAAEYSYNSGDVFHEHYVEGLYVGYRYFDTFGVPVRYPFGYGLSYTTFSHAVEGVTLRAAEGTPCYGAGGGREPSAEVRVRVTNTGRAAGREVAQVYASAPDGRLEKEYRRLAGFAKTRVLAPGESEELRVEIPLYLLASYDEALPGFVLEAGRFGLWEGADLAGAALCALLELESERVLVRTRRLFAQKTPLAELRQPAGAAAARYAAWSQRAVPVLPLPAALLPCTEAVYDAPADPAALAAARALSTEQKISLVVGDPGLAQGNVIGSAAVSVPGAAGSTAAVPGFAGITLADGPAGLRLEQKYWVQNGAVVRQPFEAGIEHGLFAAGSGAPEGEAEARWQFCTAFPVGALLAQSWDEALLAEVGRAVAEEMAVFNVQLWLAPGMNLHRSPLCGRNFEYYSEDPVLSGRLAAAVTRGVQSVPGCGTTIKHFAANNQEDNRYGSDSIVGERALRELYLKGFELAVKSAQPLAMMTSYNLINGVHSANNRELCTLAARCEWGFQGLIMTDWLTTVHSTDSVPCTAPGCMRAGNDLVMPGLPQDFESLRAALADGTLSEAELTECAAHILGVLRRLKEQRPASL